MSLNLINQLKLVLFSRLHNLIQQHNNISNIRLQTVDIIKGLGIKQ